jgi:hypothetical protein
LRRSRRTDIIKKNAAEKSRIAAAGRIQKKRVFCGKNIKKGLNFNESMMQYDVASTIAYVFGLKQPQVWIGRPMKQVFK